MIYSINKSATFLPIKLPIAIPIPPSLTPMACRRICNHHPLVHEIGCFMIFAIFFMVETFTQEFKFLELLTNARVIFCAICCFC